TICMINLSDSLSRVVRTEMLNGAMFGLFQALLSSPIGRQTFGASAAAFGSLRMPFLRAPRQKKSLSLE
ncbi:MAG: hypothetical protein AAGB11_18830, partial [Pseudomonadota bacterium]